MKTPISIIMYHYVRQLKHSHYSKIKGLDTELFAEQIRYLIKHYHVISAYELMDAIDSNATLPRNALLLTFDDAYIDHFTQVFPILDKHKIPGLFFPPAKCILEHKILDVNKIHFILASVSNQTILTNEIYAYLDENRQLFHLKENDFYWDNLAIKSRFDNAETIFIKRILQRELPEQLRNTITDGLFQKHVSNDEASFSQELYMSTEQIAHLQRNNMYVGSHGFDHYWLNSIPEDKQEKEIDKSLDFLAKIGSSTERWIMCYPYGAYDETLLRILKERNCVAGLTTEVQIADLSRDNPLTLPRLDTNDIPKQANAVPNEWFNLIC